MNKIIEMKNIRKLFPGVVALDNITFDLYPGEVHAFIGENGAGKSTLMKILSGVYTPTKGEIIINQEKYSELTPKQSLENGISVIFQELSVINELTIAENLFIGRHPTKNRLGFQVIDYKRIYEITRKLLKRVGLNVKPTDLVGSLSLSQKQLVEIAKALATNAKVIIMDEPSSSLNIEEIEKLFEIIHDLKKDGVGVVYISHKINELREIGDRITIIRDGKSVATKPIEEIGTNDEIASLMVGRELKAVNFNKEHSNITSDVIFEGKNITREDNKANAVNFKLYQGEVLGFAGLVGAGRSELMNAIYGAEKMKKGEVFLNNKKINVISPYHSIKNGICMITEDRRQTGIFENFEIWRNIGIANSLKNSKLNGTWGLLNSKKEKQLAEEYKLKMRVKASSINEMIGNLSGGNQQKVIIGKWLATNAQILIFDEPTRGIDVGAKAEIYKTMRELANDGVGIIMVSSDLPELLTICDRIAVYADGNITKVFSSEEATEEKIILAAT